MLKIRIITVGSIKEKYLRDACAEYLKRLSAFGQTEVIELKESLLPDDPSDEQIKEYEESIGKDEEINYALLSENDKTFRECMMYGEFYICILSEHLLEEWSKNGDFVPFLPIADYLPEGAKFVTGGTAPDEETYVLASEYGVYLSEWYPIVAFKNNPFFFLFSTPIYLIPRS